jgi:hypothetical protein
MQRDALLLEEMIEAAEQAVALVQGVSVAELSGGGCWSRQRRPGFHQPLAFQLLQRGRADRGPPPGQHCAGGHHMSPPPRHRQQVPQQRRHHVAGIRVRHQRQQQHGPDREGDNNLDFWRDRARSLSVT